MSSLTLVLGGARSGKSAFAEQLALARGSRVLYVASAEAHDEEMRARVRAHRDRRPPSWDTLEAPLDPVAALRSQACRYDAILFDCLTVWLSNLLLHEMRALAPHGPRRPDAKSRADGRRLSTRMRSDLAADAAAAVQGLLAWQQATPTELIVVSDEVGMCLVPSSPLGRLFRDLLGDANQALAAAADEVHLVVAGLASTLKAPNRRSIAESRATL